MALTKVTRSGLTDNSINADKIEDGTLVDADLTPGTITNAKLAGSIANAKLANSTITINGASVALGASTSAGSIAWQSVVVSDGSTVTTMVAGRGYFINNTSAAGLVKLPTSASAGDTIAIKDYAANFGTNNLTIQRNGHNIQGVANDSTINTNRASVVLVYIDATKGWLYTNESNVSNLGPSFIEATGGTVTESGNFKIHTFTGDGCFVVSSLGGGGTPCAQATKVEYVVVAGGGGAGGGQHVHVGGGGGAGGHRESSGTTHGPYTVSPLGSCVAALTVTAGPTTYPVTVGGGGNGGTNGGTQGSTGSNSVFSTITSTGGGGGGAEGDGSSPQRPGGNGGSGGGGSSQAAGTGGSGNTPPVSPPQGNNGGNATDAPPDLRGGGGGGATAAGGVGTNSPFTQGAGGAGATNHITGSPVTRAGGGGAGGTYLAPSGVGGAGGSGGGGAGGAAPSTLGTAGTANTGGGGGSPGVGPNPSPDKAGGAGGKGIVIIRYKFQN